MNNGKYYLWRKNPSFPARCLRDNSPYPEFRIPQPSETLLFPSGRQALTASLAEAGLSRSDLIAVPQWSSHCVLSALSKIGTPVPYKEVLNYDIQCAAVILYEQWGWFYDESYFFDFFEKFSESTIILDRVDTPGFNKEISSIGSDVYQLWSLSKTLGCKNAGLALKPNGQWLSPVVQERSKDVEFIDSNVALFSDDFLKNYATYADLDSKKLVENKLLFDSWFAEGIERTTRAAFIINSVSDDFNLKHRLDIGSMPGVFPAVLGGTEKARIKMLEKCFDLKIEARVYNFDVSADPLDPDYRKCVAVPIHSEIPMDILDRLFS